MTRYPLMSEAALRQEPPLDPPDDDSPPSDDAWPNWMLQSLCPWLFRDAALTNPKPIDE